MPLEQGMDQEPGTAPAAPSERTRILSPVERSSEVIFGLIMALSFTGSLSIAEAGREELRTMLVGALGCNVAWGVVDAVMYVVTGLVARRRALHLLETVRAEVDGARGRGLIADSLPPLIGRLVRPAELEHVRVQLMAMPETPHAGVTSRDLLGALGVFLLVFLSTFPVAIPFLLPVEPVRALRISNGIALVMLFVVGWWLGSYSGRRPLGMAASMVAIGAALVAMTVALGG